MQIELEMGVTDRLRVYSSVLDDIRALPLESRLACFLSLPIQSPSMSFFSIQLIIIIKLLHPEAHQFSTGVQRTRAGYGAPRLDWQATTQIRYGKSGAAFRLRELCMGLLIRGEAIH